MNTTNQATAIRIQSKDYLCSAEHLITSVEANQIELNRSDPIDQLVGHAFELALKSKVLREFPDTKVKRFRHNILDLHDYSQSLGINLSQISISVAKNWRARLAKDRQQLVAKFGSYASALTELGLPTLDDIETMHFILRNDISWYSQRMIANGNQFRYHETRMDITPHVGFWGVNYHRPRQSLIWATKLLNT